MGYDRRFLSTEFARTTAEAITDQGFDVLLSQSYAPTPAFSFVAKHQGCDGYLNRDLDRKDSLVPGS